MAGQRFPLLNFAKGELAPPLLARHDVQAYSAGVARARNVKIKKYGGLEKRPGTRFVAEVYDDSEPTRLLPFQFSFEQAYALEFGQAYMRVAALGGMVLEEELAVDDISSDADAVFEVQYHDYAVGDQLYFTEQEGDWAYLNGRFWAVTEVVDEHHFKLGEVGTGNTFDGSTGGTTRTGAPPAPPPPPPVPDPIDPPDPPDIGGGGGFCVTEDALILMGDRSEKPAGEIVSGDVVRTRHESTMQWGSYRVSKVEKRTVPVWRVELGGKVLWASAGHLIWHGSEWVRADELGTPDGEGTVVLMSVHGARTYIANGILSHNKAAR